MSRYVSPVETITDRNGAPTVGAKLVFYETGTTTLKTVYSDAGLSVAIANPVTAVSSDAGAIYPDIYLDGVYKVVQQDDTGTAGVADGVVLWTRDPVGDVAVGNFQTWLNDTTYDIPEVVYASNDKYYISLVDANQGNEPSASPTQWQEIPIKGIYSTTQSLAKGADIASAAALTISNDGNYFDVTGSTTVTSIDTVGIGTVIKLHFDASLTLTHHATDLILPGAIDIITEAGDEAEFIEYAAGDWRCVNYQPYSQVLRTKIIDIGDWDMVATAAVSIPHGLTLANIRSISATVRQDAPGGQCYNINSHNGTFGTSAQGVNTDDVGNATVRRATGGIFDSTSFDSTSYNRGWVTIHYVG